MIVQDHSDDPVGPPAAPWSRVLADNDLCVGGCVHGLWVPLGGRGVRVPEAGATGGCEPPKQVLGIKVRLSGRAASLSVGGRG